MGLPSRAQLHYLKGLGYTGPAPETSLEASVAIDALKAGEDSTAAHRAILDERRQAAEEERRQEEADELQNAMDDLEAERELQDDLAAIDAEFGPSPGRGPSLIGCLAGLIAAPFRLAWWTIRNVAYGVALVVLAPFRLLGWTIDTGANLAGQAAAASGKGTVAASRAGSAIARQRVVPWIRAQDWKGLAIATGLAVRAAGKHAAALLRVCAVLTDRALKRFAGEDGILLWILRVAVFAAVALGVGTVVLVLVR